MLTQKVCPTCLITDYMTISLNISWAYNVALVELRIMWKNLSLKHFDACCSNEFILTIGMDRLWDLLILLLFNDCYCQCPAGFCIYVYLEWSIYIYIYIWLRIIIFFLAMYFFRCVYNIYYEYIVTTVFMFKSLLYRTMPFCMFSIFFPDKTNRDGKFCCAVT